jgi:predicted DNA-binding protein
VSSGNNLFLENCFPLGDGGAVNTKEPRVSVRVSEQLKRRLESAVNQTGIDEAIIVRNCLEAVCDEVERSGSLVFPLSVTGRGNTGALDRSAGSSKARINCHTEPSGAHPINETRKRK